LAIALIRRVVIAAVAWRISVFRRADAACAAHRAGVLTSDLPREWPQHSFLNNPDLPESKDMHSIVVKFFDRHLGRSETRSSRM
jgi:hypothetical protein